MKNRIKPNIYIARFLSVFDSVSVFSKPFKMHIFLAILGNGVCFADTVSFTYAPSASVRGDVAEDDLIENDDFSFLTVEPGIYRSVKWTYERDPQENPVYLEYG